MGKRKRIERKKSSFFFIHAAGARPRVDLRGCARDRSVRPEPGSPKSSEDFLQGFQCFFVVRFLRLLRDDLNVADDVLPVHDEERAGKQTKLWPFPDRLSTAPRLVSGAYPIGRAHV